MNKPLIPARTRKFIGVGVLAVSLLAVSTGCSAGDTKEAAPAAPLSTEATASATPSAEAKKTLRTRFVRVIDGDTIEVQPVSEKNGQPTGEPSFKVHMLGVTAPEATACGGAESIANLQSLFRPNEPVAVKYEPTLNKDADEDGNTLAYVITGTGVTQDTGYRMVQEGFATASYPEDQTAPKNYSQYTETSKITVDQKRGIWASCPAPKG
jgi:endonuclease YncB( thermonuclease family)